MRKKVTDDQLQVRGLYINEVIRGFFGEQNEGKKLLQRMGLPTTTTPFSAAAFLQNQHTYWCDKDGNKATISFKFKPNQLECFGTYLQRRKSYRVFLEWGNEEDAEKIARLESEAIGELCMKCIYENLID